MSRTHVTFILLSLLLAGIVAAQAPQPAPAELKGSYQVSFSGDWKGSDKVNIGGAGLNMNCKLEVDGARKAVHLKCKLPVAGGHFVGAGTIDGQSVKVNGRVESGFGGGPMRISGMMSDLKNGRFARFSGVRKGNEEKPDDN
jgi:hypothetical protein